MPAPVLSAHCGDRGLLSSEVGPPDLIVLGEPHDHADAAASGLLAVWERRAWGVGLSDERSDIAGAESFYSLEGNCGTVMRGAVALPGSKATSRAKGSHRKLGGLVSGRQRRVRETVRIGKVRSRSR